MKEFPIVSLILAKANLALIMGCLWCLALLSFCTPSPSPSPMPPDATDGAPWTSDAGLTPCQAACSTLAALGCSTQPDCVTVLAHIDGARLVRTSTGAPLTCGALAIATSKAEVAALGVSCP